MAIRSILQSGLAGIDEASDRFERSAAEVTRLAGAPSAAETAETVRISPEARNAGETRDAVSTSGLEGAVVDTRVAKYAFIASLKALQSGGEMEEEAAKLGK